MSLYVDFLFALYDIYLISYVIYYSYICNALYLLYNYEVFIGLMYELPGL